MRLIVKNARYRFNRHASRSRNFDDRRAFKFFSRYHKLCTKLTPQIISGTLRATYTLATLHKPQIQTRLFLV